MRSLFVLLLLISPWVRADISVQDYQGTKISLAEPAQRIIGLAPHVVENIYSAGAGEKVVGVMAYSNFPEAVLKLPVVGDYSRINYELITALKPDLIVAWNSGRQLEAAVKLRDLGFKVYVDDPHSLEDVARSIRDIALLAGSEKTGDEVTTAYIKRLAELRKKYLRPGEKVSVLYQVWIDPLQTLNGQHIVSDVIRMCGGRNIFSDAPNIAPKINVESVIARNPEVILSGGTAEDQVAYRKYWQRWPVIDAVKKQQIFTLPSDLISRHTVRILGGAQYLCEHLQKARPRGG